MIRGKALFTLFAAAAASVIPLSAQPANILPNWYGVWWFWSMSAVTVMLLIWLFHRVRLHQRAQEFSVQIEERTRIARELHDTLLQSFQAQLITAAGQELMNSDAPERAQPVFRVIVEGEKHALKPLLQDEVYRVARKLLRNAFRHSEATRIEAEIRYESRRLRVYIPNDRKGIDPEVLRAGSGHWGLPGMREQVKRLGGSLEFWSEAAAGTEALLTVPGGAAYETTNGSPSPAQMEKRTEA